FYTHKPDIVLLDVVMPGMDGWQTCTRIRDVSDVPIVMLTGQRKAEEDIIRGLDYGADEYMVKPVGNKELAARVQAVLRRADLPSTLDKEQKASYSDDYLTVNINDHKVFLNGERVKLTPTEFRLLALLVQNAGRVITHRQVLERVWGWEYVDDLDHVRVYIWHLRQKIEVDPANPRYILSESGVGYYFQKAGTD
ncbi:MAG: response regulator transcription factor, partial [Dehalococcoidia bacterium]|nr:response regulator transcription factor [Dehalococcoidia bacterium]